MTRVNQLENIEEHDVEDFLCVLFIFFGTYRVLSSSSSFVCVLCIFGITQGHRGSQMSLTSLPLFLYFVEYLSNVYVWGTVEMSTCLGSDLIQND